MAGDATNATLTDLPADRYTVLQQLGKNAGRQTLLAQDHQINKMVVIKLLTFDQEFEWEDLKLFEREAETLKTLSHLNIPQFLDFFEIETAHAKKLALVQSYVAERSLADHLMSGHRFSAAEIREIGRALLHILAYLHGRQPPVIHRDIKPSNIILGDRSAHSIGQVYLVDFGSVQHLAAHAGDTITVVGTYGYMPPEQFGGRTTPASDLYGLGATLIYLITGRHPAELPQQDCRIQFRAAASLNPDFADWLEQMTEPSLDRRFSAAQSALQALENPQPKKQRRKSLIKRPPQTEIVLNQSADSFEAILPSAGISWSSIALLCFSIPLWIWVAILGSPFTDLSLAIFPFPIAFIVTIAFLSRLLQDFAKHRLRIHAQTVTLTLEWFGLTMWRRSFQQKAIEQIIIQTRALRVDPIVILRFVRQETSNAGHLLFYLHISTEAEADWLAAELNQWLDIPFEWQERDIF